MKILGISCSPRRNGNTEILLNEALSGARDRGAETELLSLGDKNMKPCDGCSYCESTGKCRIEDDVQEMYEKLLGADGMIWATPVYFFNVTAQAKILIDRLYPLYLGGKLANKVGGVISVASSLGHQGVWNTFTTLFSVHRIFYVDFAFGFARMKGDIRKDRHSMKAAWELGREVAAMTERRDRYPEGHEVPMYIFVKEKHKIDMCPSMGRFEEEKEL